MWRLKGVDAAERGTPLGDEATQVMRGIVNGSDLHCQLTGEHTWKREVGYCFTEAGVDINREIIAMGAALACPRYDTRYVPDNCRKRWRRSHGLRTVCGADTRHKGEQDGCM